MRYVAIALLILIVSGCAGVQNKLEAQLMPETIAKREILGRYFGQAWADNPTGRYSQGLGFLCGNSGKGPMPYNEIIRVIPSSSRISVQSGSLLLMGVPCQIQQYDIRGQYSQQDINDIVDALVSLGAKIDEVKNN